MYKIIGSDGREYGPVSAAQLHQWIAEGRINAQTQVLPEGAAAWQPLGSLPEFAETRGAAPPAIGRPAADFDIISCIARSWQLVKANLGLVIAACLLYMLIIVGIGMALRFGVNLATGTAFRTYTRNPWHLLQMQWKGFAVQYLWQLLVTGPMIGGLYLLFLKLIRGQPASVGDLFGGFGSQFGSLVAGCVVMGTLEVLGIFCCVIPGIYLGVGWKFALPAIADKKLGFWDGMQASRQAVTGRWWLVFALLLLSGLLAGAGVLACCIGVLVTIPISIGAVAYAYEDLIGHAAS